MSRFYAFPPNAFPPTSPVAQTMSPSDVPLGFSQEVQGNIMTCRIVYPAGSEEPLERASASHTRVGYGRYSLRLFELAFEVSTAPTADVDAFARWCMRELHQVIAVLRDRVTRTGPRLNYEITSRGLSYPEGSPPPWLISALKDMRGTSDSSRRPPPSR